MKIKKVEIEGFRAYKFKKDATFDFTTDGQEPSNFIAICAPNGFGKSSFYDAVEWAFTANLERYVRDHNRKNNELAARSTKQAGIAQCILRNKDVPDDIQTTVSVQTTQKQYTRTLPRTKTNSRDIRFNKNETEKGTEFFQHIILSQDAIDRFLREVKPQERYSIFMEHFGGDNENLRQEITALLNENKNILLGLRKQRDELGAQLTEPMDESIFSEFNTVAIRLNERDESVLLVSRDFTANKEHEIVSFIMTRIHELSSVRNLHITSHDVLKEQLSRLPDIQRAQEIIVSQKPKELILAQGVNDSKRYQGFFRSYEKYEEDLQEVKQRLDNLNEVKGYIPSYSSAMKELNSEAELQTSLNHNKLEKETALSGLKLSVEQYNKSLNTANQRKLSLESLLNGCGAIYSDISINQAALASLNSELASKITTLNVDCTDRDRVKEDISKISNFKVDAKTLLTDDISLLRLESGIVDRFQEISCRLKTLDIQDKRIRRTQDALTQQVGIIERLVALGLDYLSENPTNICPLCQAKHGSPKDLKSAMTDNDLVSSLIKDNAYNLEQLSSQKRELEEQLNLILTDVFQCQSQRITKLQQKLNDLGLKISELDNVGKKLQLQISQTQKYIEECKVKVWSLEQDELVRRITAEIGTLMTNQNGTLKLINTANAAINATTLELPSINVELQSSQLKVAGTSSQAYYQKVKTFLEKNNIQNIDLFDFCAKEIDRVSEEQLELIKRRDKTVLDCNTLKIEMMEAGNWIDFSALNNQYAEISLNLKNLEHTVNSFYVSLENYLGKTVSRSVEFTRNTISESIDIEAKKSNDLSSKISDFNLLLVQLKAFKPYLQNLTLRETLVDVESRLAEHLKVEGMLSKELETIFENLSERIKAFFYTDLINSIYSKIDPHPSFKKVEFVADFGDTERPKLSILITDDSGDTISPNLFFSAAQLNILSLSVFLARALHAKDDKGAPLDLIMIDDPIQSMDSINVLAMIDLLRNVSVKFDKQIIISTHDENFFGLLQRKIPSEIFRSKFMRLESFGVVADMDSKTVF